MSFTSKIFVIRQWLKVIICFCFFETNIFQLWNSNVLVKKIVARFYPHADALDNTLHKIQKIHFSKQEAKKSPCK